MKKGIKVLITGGAGFIGSNLVKYFIQDDRISLVRVIDDLSTGLIENIEMWIGHSKFEFLKGDICDYHTCVLASKGIDKISHHAALGSVPRSIENPMRTTEVNIVGTVNILHAAHINKVDRVVLACSSSAYGDSSELPKVENHIGNPLSPYAISKYCIEQMAEVFHKVYGLNYIGFRYFNVFGPHQNPFNPYAAVIPIFCNSFLNNERPVIYGDGHTSRDFTYIDNVILANKLALFTTNKSALNQIYNAACGNQISLLAIVKKLNDLTKKNLDPIFLQERDGDIKNSKANIKKIKVLLNYTPIVTFDEGLLNSYNWYKKKFQDKIN